MNKKFLKYYMETEPEGTTKKYIFLVDNQDIAMNNDTDKLVQRIYSVD